jgi:hypothetical protein
VKWTTNRLASLGIGEQFIVSSPIELRGVSGIWGKHKQSPREGVLTECTSKSLAPIFIAGKYTADYELGIDNHHGL